MWDNPDLILFHGTDLISANRILTPGDGRMHSVRVNVHVAAAKRYLDFGPGFYLTSRLDQAIAWANTRQMRLTVKATPPAGDVVAAGAVDDAAVDPGNGAFDVGPERRLAAEILELAAPALGGVP